ncbi:hypothetical protein RRSWK_06409 [Rhodopirellula sp. SWK7]|nr:hypothetical protein RRSWK_06409 [Rhodopirellula sp. SWK7]
MWLRTRGDGSKTKSESTIGSRTLGESSWANTGAPLTTMAKIVKSFEQDLNTM